MHSDGTPLVSVIVPAFNCQLYLCEALVSLCNQTVEDVEIIVVDDGSTDGTGDIATAYAKLDSRVRVIRRQIPSGRPACARNEGLRIASGEYIALLDADDISMPMRLASCIAAMLETGSHFAFADYRQLHQDTGKLADHTVLETTNFLERAASYLRRSSDDVYLCSTRFPAFLLTGTPVNTPTVVFKRELLGCETIWFDESLVCSEDVDLWFRLAKHTSLVFVNQVHSLNRRHSASLTASNQFSTQVDAISVRRAHLTRLRDTLSPHELNAANIAVAHLHSDLAYSNWCSGNLKYARAQFVKSWQAKPTLAAVAGYFKAFVGRDAAVATVERLVPSRRES